MLLMDVNVNVNCEAMLLRVQMVGRDVKQQQQEQRDTECAFICFNTVRYMWMWNPS